jgi:DNA primase
MADIELIKSKLDIVEVISSYIELKRAGANFKANCPFHNEKTASFMVNPTLQMFKCFGCQKAGDAITFIQEMERVEFIEALKIAAEKAGVVLEEGSFKRNTKEEKEKEKIIEANTLTAKYYNYILKTHNLGKPGREYATRRQLNSEVIETFMFGFAPSKRDNLKKFLISKGFDPKDLIKWGLLVERNGYVVDKFWERLMQPIFNLKGEVIGFSGRYIGTKDGPPKYLNSPETLVYKKNEILYGLYQSKESIRTEKFIIIVEGNIDVVSSHRVGVKNIVAPLGTAFTPQQAKLIKRHSDELYFCFDTDSAGIAALIKGLALAEEAGLKHKVIDVHPFKDSDELICKNPQEWIERIKNAKSIVEYLISLFSQDVDLGSADGKSKFESKIIPVLKALKDEVLLNHYSKEVSMLLEIPETSVLEMVKSEIKVVLKKQQEDELPKKTSTTLDRNLEMYLLSLLVQSNTLLNVGLEKDFFLDESCRSLFEKFSTLKDLKEIGSLKDKLDEESMNVLTTIMLFDITKVKDLDAEIEYIFNRVYAKYLKHEILSMRKILIREPENEEYLVKLNEMSKELKDVVRDESSGEK